MHTKKKCETVVSFWGWGLEDVKLSSILGVGGFKCENVVNVGGWWLQSVRLSSTLAVGGLGRPARPFQKCETVVHFGVGGFKV